jgi:hypothetical protein
LVSVERESGESEPTARSSVEAARLEFGAQARRSEQAKAPPQTVPGHVAAGRARRESLHEALEAARAEHRVQAQRFREARAQLQAIVEWIETGRPQQEVLRDSAFARMQARLESLPVIEQAKGILMAQQRCGPEEAFDLLRRASQGANLKLHVLAAHIVDQVASPPANTSAQPTQRAANKHR